MNQKYKIRLNHLKKKKKKKKKSLEILNFLLNYFQ